MRGAALPAETSSSAVCWRESRPVVSAVLDDDLEAAGGAEAVDRGGAEDADEALDDLGFETFAEGFGDCVSAEGGIAPVVELVEHDVHGAEVGGVGVEQDGLSGDGEGVADAGDVAGDGFDAGHEPAHLVGGGGVGELDVDEEVALVLRGDEAGGGALDLFVGEVEEACRRWRGRGPNRGGRGRRGRCSLWW